MALYRLSLAFRICEAAGTTAAAMLLRVAVLRGSLWVGRTHEVAWAACSWLLRCPTQCSAPDRCCLCVHTAGMRLPCMGAAGCYSLARAQLSLRQQHAAAGGSHYRTVWGPSPVPRPKWAYERRLAGRCLSAVTAKAKAQQVLYVQATCVRQLLGEDHRYRRSAKVTGTP